MPSVCLVATLHLGCSYFSESINCLPSDILWYSFHIKVLDTKLSSFFHLVHYFTKTVYKRMDNTYRIYTTRKWICCCDFRPCFSEYSDQPLVILQASQKSVWNKIKSNQIKTRQNNLQLLKSFKSLPPCRLWYVCVYVTYIKVLDILNNS